FFINSYNLNSSYLEKYQHPFLEKDIKGEGKNKKTDISVKNWVRAAEWFLVEVEQDRIPTVSSLRCNQKTGNQKKTDDDEVDRFT
ncbi:MAG: hypothetical protein QGI64_03955, partial [Desulfobacterales bacterium]|nr:hypothetical protein [Desulfobacterales bacterium]